MVFSDVIPEEPVGELRLLDSPDIDEVAIVGINYHIDY